MSRAAGQYFYLACRLAKAGGMFVIKKPHGEATDYFLYRSISHARPALVGKRSNAAALLALVERATQTTPANGAPSAPTAATH